MKLQMAISHKRGAFQIVVIAGETKQSVNRIITLIKTIKRILNGQYLRRHNVNSAGCNPGNEMQVTKSLKARLLESQGRKILMMGETLRSNALRALPAIPGG